MDLHRIDYQNETACYDTLIGLLHPEGQACPRCGDTDRQTVHHRRRLPLIGYRCSRCRCTYNAWTDTPLQGTHLRPSELLQIVRAIVDRQATRDLARNLRRSRETIRFWRRNLLSAIRKELPRLRRAARDKQPADP